MKTTKLLLTAACAFFVSTAAFAQTTPTTTSPSGTMGTQTGTGTMQNGTMSSPSGTMGTQTGTGTMQNGTMGTDGASGSRMDRKTKMNSSKGTKKSKMSTTPSSTGTM